MDPSYIKSSLAIASKIPPVSTASKCISSYLVELGAKPYSSLALHLFIATPWDIFDQWKKPGSDSIFPKEPYNPTETSKRETKPGKPLNLEQCNYTELFLREIYCFQSSH